MWLFQLPQMVGTLLYPAGRGTGIVTSAVICKDPLFSILRQSYYCDYSPTTPEAINIGENHILILMACNDKSKVIDRIVADKA